MKNFARFIVFIALATLFVFPAAASGLLDSSTSTTKPKSTPSKSAPSKDTQSSGQGTLTITGLGEYNGRFVYTSGSGDNEKEIVGAVVFNESPGMMVPRCVTGGKIENGRVTLPVWQVATSHLDDYGEYNYTYARYAGNGASEIQVMIWEDEEVYLGMYTFPIADGTMSVTFKNGIAEGAANVSVNAVNEYGMYEK
ncbi:MAG: hypothetical protein LBH44_03880 [Treponema sp.]|jgi:hypothetical protein|nr:hypothetical protein [Treponema sp.]